MYSVVFANRHNWLTLFLNLYIVLSTVSFESFLSRHNCRPSTIISCVIVIVSLVNTKFVISHILIHTEVLQWWNFLELFLNFLCIVTFGFGIKQTITSVYQFFYNAQYLSLIHVTNNLSVFTPNLAPFWDFIILPLLFFQDLLCSFLMKR